MNTLEILIEGYAKITDTGWNASSTVTLITTDSGIKIICDPGANRDLLLQQLKAKSYLLEAINYVFITHHHLDHAMNVGLFPNAKIVDEEAIYTQSLALKGVKMIPHTDITILATPGHEYGHAVLVVPTKEGTVVVAGDNFWWPEGEDQKININKQDNFATDMPALIKSRKEILSIADYIIPGHGKGMAVKK